MAWPVVVLVSGILLLFLLYALHTKSNWAMIWRDMQQREHTIIAIAIAIAGLAELLSSASSVFDSVWPAAILCPFVLFIAAVQLLLYHEPEGAYEGELTHKDHSGH